MPRHDIAKVSYKTRVEPFVFRQTRGCQGDIVCSLLAAFNIIRNSACFGEVLIGTIPEKEFVILRSIRSFALSLLAAEWADEYSRGVALSFSSASSLMVARELRWLRVKTVMDATKKFR